MRTAMKALFSFLILLFISAVLSIILWERIARYLFICTDPGLFAFGMFPPFIHDSFRTGDKYFFPESVVLIIWLLVFGTIPVVLTLSLLLSRSALGTDGVRKSD